MEIINSLKEVELLEAIIFFDKKAIFRFNSAEL